MNLEDDIDVLGQEEHDDYNYKYENFTETPFQLFMNSNKSDSTPPQSLHVLQSAYDDLRRRYNETKQKYEIMSRAVRDMETQRLGQVNRPYSVSNGFGAAYAAGTEAAAGGAENTSHADITNAQVRAQLGYAESLQRQIMKMQSREKEMERKYTDLYAKYKRLEDDVATLQQRNRKMTAEMQTKNVEKLQNSDQLSAKLEEKEREIKEKEREINQLNKLNSNFMERCKILEERLKSGGGPESFASPVSVIQEKHIISMIEEQNAFLEELKQKLRDQELVIKKQNTQIKELNSKKRPLSAPSSFIKTSEGVTGGLSSGQPRARLASDNQLQQHQPFLQYINTQEISHPTEYSSHLRPDAINTGYVLPSHGAVMCTSDAEHFQAPKNIVEDYRTRLMPDRSDGEQNECFREDTNFRQPMRQLHGAVPRYSVSQSTIGPDTKDALARVPSTSSEGVNQGLQDMRIRMPRESRQPVLHENDDSPNTVLVKTGAAAPQNNIIGIDQIHYPPLSPRQQQESSEQFQPMRYPDERRMQNLRLDDRTLLDPYSPVDSRPTTGHARINPDRPGMLLENADYENLHIPVRNNDYLNIAEARQSEQTPRQTARSSQNPNQQICPVCSKNFGNMPMQEFQMHVFDCVDGNESEENLNTLANVNRETGHKECPMCNAAFPEELPQEEFERHVQEHFGEDGNFEVLRP